MIISPKLYGLPARTVLERLNNDTIAIVVNRKSRIIMADGTKIQDKAETIRQVEPSVKVVLKTTAPVCSKTIKFLETAEIETIHFTSNA